MNDCDALTAVPKLTWDEFWRAICIRAERYGVYHEMPMEWLEWKRVTYELSQLTGEAYELTTGDYSYPPDGRYHHRDDKTGEESRGLAARHWLMMEFFKQQIKQYGAIEPRVREYCLTEMRRIYGRN